MQCQPAAHTNRAVCGRRARCAGGARWLSIAQGGRPGHPWTLRRVGAVTSDVHRRWRWGQELLDVFELDPLDPFEPLEPEPPDPESLDPLLEPFESPPELLDPLDAALLESLESFDSFDFTGSVPPDEPLRLSVR